MNRIEAVAEFRGFINKNKSKFSALPCDASGKTDVTEIRKLLAVDAELSIALATLLAVVLLSMEHEARAEINTAFTNGG